MLEANRIIYFIRDRLQAISCERLVGGNDVRLTGSSVRANGNKGALETSKSNGAFNVQLGMLTRSLYAVPKYILKLKLVSTIVCAVVHFICQTTVQGKA